ncbi:MAG: DUF4292 domain-containing protein [Prevotella sp.]|nr:DUF4292 domain-containing protein [Prevotella sp.]
MKVRNLLMMAALAAPFMLTGCKSKKQVADTPKPVTTETIQQQKFLQQVSDNAQFAKFVTTKVKFSVEVGVQKLTLTGNLKMKRNDVIRLQLMAFGFVEAGRIEFTPDYVLIMDRINKQYLKASYAQLDFLRNTGLNFYSLQSLFWNELFIPGQAKVTDEALKKYEADMTGEDVVISLDQEKMSYRWLATKDQGKIRMANIMYNDRFNGTTQLNWDYENFALLNRKPFPLEHTITFTSPKKEVKLGMVLNYIGSEDNWETRTDVSAKYREVTVDEILRRFMAL